MSTFKYPINTILGRVEGNNISNIVNQRDNFVLQEKQFSFYYGKLQELINSHEFTLTNEWNILNIPYPADAIQFIVDIILMRFNEMKYIEFPIYILGYLIILSYITTETKNYGNTLYYPEKYLKEVKDVFLSIDTFVEKAYDMYRNVAPFFGKYCAFGYKTFLDLYIHDGIFLIGMGSNCINVHCVLFTSNFAVTFHDIHHYNIIKRNKLYNHEYMISIYNRILLEDKSLQPGLIYILFMLVHENSSYDILYSHITNNLCGTPHKTYILNNFGISDVPSVTITNEEKKFFNTRDENTLFATFIYFWRIYSSYLQ